MRHLIVALFACIGISFHVFSQVVTPFTVRKTLTQKGGILFLSNTSSRANPANIVQNQIPPSGTAYNNSFTNTYVDIDSDPTTWMSSSDQLNLPVCSEISWAGLYWGADCSLGDENYATRNSIKLKVDNGSYMDLTADEMQDNTVGYKTYHCFKDITTILQANSLTSNYTVANMAGDVNGTNLFGGWTIVVMYKNNTMTMRNLTVFNGLANVSSAAPTVDIPISGFQTPLSGPVTFELGLVLYDGDRSLTGDQLMFKGASSFINISDAIHTTSDVFNSTLARNGALTPLRNPNYNNTLGYDANIFAPNNSAKNYIGNNAVSAVIRQTTGGEWFLTQVVTSAIDVYEPDLRAAVRVQNITQPGATIAQSGDILEYTVTGLNIGSDPSVNTYILDTIEGNAFYVPGSLSIVSGPNAGPLSDALGDDQGEYLSSSKVIKVRIGNGANSFLGGEVNNSPSGADSTQFKFRVQVTSDCVYLSCDGTINNKAFIIGTGNVSGNTFSNASNPGVFDSNGCAISGTTATPIDVSGCGPITASANSPICQGGDINFTASYSPAATYVWTGPNGFISNQVSPTITNVQAANAGTYTANIYITGTPCHFVYPFVADISIANAGNDMNGISTCGLTQVTLAGNNPTGTTGVWTIISGTGGSFGTGNTSTSTDPNALFNGVSGNTYVLRWTLTSPGCTPTIDDVTVTFLQAPTAATLTGISATCANQLNVAITGGVSPYTLSIDNGVGTVSNYISGTNISVSPNATTTYTLSTVTGANGCQLALTSSNTATITVSSSVSGGVIAPVVALNFTTGNSGEKFPTSNSVISSGNNNNADWTNPSNAYTDNGSAATATGDKDETKFLYLRNFGFSIPSNAVIDGVVVKIDKKRENLSGKNVYDNKVTLVATTTTLGSNKAVTSTNWPTDYTVSTYGSSTDMWGNTTSALTPSVVNGSNFGLGIAADLSSSSSKAYIDYASITIYYHIGNNSYCDTESAVSFNISGVTGATSYNWVPPTGAIITAGQGTATATIDFNGAGQSGNYTIMCTPSNACGAGTPATLTIPITDCTNPTPLCVSGNVYWDYNGNNIVDGTGIGMVNSTQLYVTVARTSNTTTSFITTPVNSNGTWKACHSNIVAARALRVTLNTSNYANGTSQSSTTVTLPTGVTVNGEINNNLGNTLTGLGTTGTGTDGSINGQLNFTTVDPMTNNETNLNFGLKINTPPVANDNTITTNEDVAVTVNVATNDTDVDGTVSASTVDLNTSTSGTQTTFTQAGVGTFTVNASGVVTFTPVANYNGTTTITYSIKDNDALVSNSANITVTVVPVNDPPVATASSVTTIENITYGFHSTDFNYTDLEGDQLQSITIASLPSLGTLILNGVNVTVGQTILVAQISALSYVPPTNQSGTPFTTFNFKANDASLGTIAGVMTINITNVDVAPTAVDDLATTDQGTAVSFNILTNDLCQDGTIVVSSVDLDPNTTGQQTSFTIPGQGSFSVNATGTVTFTPVSTFYGTTTPIEYTITSSLGMVSNTADIIVTVIPFGSPIAVDDAATTPKNVTVVFSATNNDTDDVAIDPSRVDFEPTIPGIQQAKYVAGKGQFSADMLGNVTFTPDYNYSGVVAITYTVKDNANLVSNVANITVTVTWVNSPPIAVDDILETDEDTPVSANLLTNDYDLDVAYGNSGIINVASVDLDPLLNGTQTTRTIAGEGTYSVTNTGVLTFTPALNYNGFATPIGYVIKDLTGALSDSASIYITVNAKNDAPIAVNDTLYVSETTATNTGSITITLNDTDIDGNIDAASVDLNPNIAGIQTTFTVTNEGTYTVDANGIVTFAYSFITPVGTLTPVAYTVLDNNGLASNNGLIQVIVLSQSLPISSDDEFTILEDTPDSFDVTANDVDDYGSNPGIDPATVTLIGSLTSAAGTWSLDAANAPGEVTFTPAANFYGSASIDYTVKDLDNNISNVSTITVVVSPVNDQPTFTAGSNQTVCANAGAQLVDYWATNLSAGPVNEATQTLSFVVTNNNNALFGDQPAIDNNGNLTYSTAINQSGSATITVQLQDNGGTANGGVDLSTAQTFTITVNPALSAGTISGATNVCSNGTTTLSSTVSGGSWSSNNTAVATINASTGVVTSVSAGTADMIYTVSGTNGCADATASSTITVTTAPVAGTLAGNQAICVGSTTSFTSSATGGTWSSSSIAIATVNASGLVTGAGAGTATITYTVAGTGGCSNATATRTVTVTALPSTPAASVTTQPTCSVQTGTITFTSQAGVEYSINGTNFQTSNIFSGVAPGSYTPVVRATANNSCTTFGSSVTVNAAPGAPSTPAASVTVQPTCATSTGTIVFTTQAGVEYSIDGTNYQASATFTGVAAGTYTPKVRSTSDNTCTATGTAVTVNAAPSAPTTPAASVTVQPTCATPTGTIVFTTQAGVEYSIDGTNFQASATFTGVAAGTYTPKVRSTSDNTCTATGTAVTVNAAPSAPTTPAASVTVQPTCATPTGTIVFTTQAGVEYSIDGTNFQASATFTGVAAGTYTPTVRSTSDNTCTATGTAVTVNAAPSAPVAGTLSGTQELCAGSTTSFTSSEPGGTWSSDLTNVATIDANGLITGISSGTATITYTVAGSGSCADATATRTITVTAISAGTISGTTAICANGSTTLSSNGDAGVWSSSDTNVATIDASTGAVAGVAAGTAVMTYTVTGTGGCANVSTTATVTVTAVPNAGTISGTTAICANGSSTLTSSVTGGTWSSSNTSVATIDASTGAVTGVSAGTAIMTYTVTGTGGCADVTTTATVTVTAVPNAGTISGTTAICANGSTTLSSNGDAGAWSSSNTSVATIDASTGAVTGVAAGTAVMTYTVTGTGGCADVTTTATVTVTAVPNAGTISGTTAICANGSTTLSSNGDAGAWSSSNTSVATIDASTGAVTGVSAGTSVMTYTVTGTGGCANVSTTATVTVTAVPNAGTISGTTAICANGSSTLTSSVTGGTWSSSNTSVATIDASTGAVTGVSAGTAIMTYTVTGTGGCADVTTTATVNVTAVPNAGTISGTTAICANGSSTLTSSVTGGTWSSATPAVATINASTGAVTGVSAGTSVMTYTVTGTGGCADVTTTATVNVTAVPNAGTISGTTAICANGSTILTSNGDAGAWSSSDTNVATINASTGAVTGVAAGTAVMTYTVTGTGGCANVSTTATVTVTAVPNAGTISGTTAICANGSTTLTSNGDAGAWSSSNTSVATIDASTGAVTGVSAGTSVMTYTVTGTGGCANVSTTATVTVTAVPNAGTISGTTAICANGSTTLSSNGDAGAWSSSNTSVATIDASTGAVTGVAAGTAVMTYTVTGTGGCANVSTTATVTVTAVPNAGTISGTTAICANGSTTLSSNGDAGAWSSATPAVATIDASTGAVTGVSAGTAVMTYTVTGTGGCANVSTTATVTVTAVPNAGTISGTTAICANGSTILTSNGDAGAWSSSDTNVATINASTGAVTGVAAGTAVMTYTVTGTGGCANVSTTATVNVTAVPNAGTISGTTAICANGSSTLTSSVTGGTWSSATPAVATINASTGAVTGVAAGTAVMTYTVTGTGGCANVSTTATVTVTAVPNAGTISGTTAICANGSTTLSSNGDAGAWSSSNTSVATIDASTGAVTGVAAGTAVMTYTVTGTGGCANVSTTATVTVTAVPSAGTISGTTAICANGSTILTSNGDAGAWTSATPAVATINASTGAVAGVAAGTAVMTYTVTGTGGCANVSTTATVTVTAVPSAGTISGTTAICANGSTTLTSNGNAGGSWSSATPAVATINASTGAVTGVAAGTSVMTYTVTGTGGCANVSTTATVTVTAVPNAGTISGTTAICANGSTTLTSNGNAGGSWSSATPAVATINASTGAVTGVSAGTAVMTYTVTGTGGCANVSTTATVTVTAVPNAGTISGTTAICANGSTTLSSNGDAGAWSSATPAVATINASTGAVTGVSAGTAVMTYTVTGTGGCANVSTTATVTVTAVPSAGTISGTTAICANGSTTLSSNGDAGAWSSSNTSVATIDASTGAVTGVSAGTAVMTYTVTGTGGCANVSTTATVTVTAVPNAGTISGTTAICANGSTTLSSNGDAGAWSSSNTSVATIDASTGAVTGVSAGTAVMTYTVTGTGGCANVSTTATVTVTAVPNAGTISGTTAICANGSTTLSSNGDAGAWSSATPAVATINASTGAVTGVAAGTSVITYMVTGTGGCANVSTTATVTVTAVPNAGTISGTTAICANGSTILTSNGDAGAWSSSNTNVATIDASTGAVTGVSAGTTTISYIVTGTGGCANDTATTVVAVTAVPNAGTISGTTAICANGTTSLNTNGNVGGAWISSQPAVATINSTTGAVTGVSAGTTTITYLVTGIGGCANVSATAQVSVTPVPTAGVLSGTQAICENGSANLSSTIAGGTWTSANPAVATINSSTGAVAGVAPGTAVMTYTVQGTGGCANATQTILITVTAVPNAGTLSGTQAICANGSTQLSASINGGTWSSSNPFVASINSSTGAVTGVSAGTAVMTYTMAGSGGCANATATLPITVSAVPSAGTISGNTAICSNGASTLTSTITGGSWASASPAVATINASTGAVAGVAAGTAIMTYTVNGTGGCSNATSTATVTVTAAPTAGTISGTTALCENGTAVVTASVSGGTWSSATPAVATINATTGTITGLSAGTSVLTYTVNGSGSCAGVSASTTTTVTVTAAPTAGNISGTTAICANGSTTLTSSVPGGTWTSSVPTVAAINSSTGVVTGVSTGTTTMTYTVTGTGSCANVTATQTTIVSVTAVPTAGNISGTAAICANGSSNLTSSVSGGTWTSSNLSVATINTSTGAVSAVGAGNTTITYTVTGTGGCANVSTTATVTVTAVPTAGTISGTTAICANGSSTLTSSVSGGSWSSATPAVATINASTGAVTGVAAGTSVITYTVTGTGGCANVSTTATVTVTAVPTAGTISGTTAICANGSTTLSASVSGGAWSSATPAVATINASTGAVAGVSAGTSVMTYTVTGTGGCADVSTTATVTVTAVPTAGTIAGTTAICANGSSTLTSSVTGGTWSSATPAVATINASTGAVVGVAAGTSVITYTVTGTGGCANVSTSATVTVTAVPTAGTIAGTTAICANGSSTLTSSVTGGTWSSTTPSVATINASTGAVSAVAAGTSVMTYTVIGTGGCANVSTTATVTVTALPSIPTANATQPTCATPTGSISINTMPGVQYAINGSAYQTSNVFLNLPAGSYPLSVSSNANNACVTTGATIVINAALGAPTLPVASVTVQPTCAAPTGTIVVSAPLGAFDYSLNGVNYQSSTTFSGLAPGTYNLTARRTADQTCISTALSLTINAVTALPTTPSAVATQPTCATPTGTISFNTQTGVQYAIDGANYVSTTTFSNLAPGNYPISVRANNDATCVSNGAVIAIVAAAGAPAAPTATATVQPTCATPTGALTITAPLGAFEYSINGTTYQAAPTFSGLNPGTYNVSTRRTTDLTCISTSTNVTINAVPALPALPTASVTQPTCAVATGTVAIVPQTGVQYALNNGTYQAGVTFAALAPGTYFPYVRNSADASCVSVGTPVVVNAVPSAPSAPTVASITQPVCGTTTGAFTIGSPIGNYEYTINGTAYQASTSFSSLLPGTYNCTARSTTDLTCISSATSVTIAPVPNCIPVATNDLASTNEDTPVSFNLTNNDTDNDGTIDAATVDLNPLVPGIQTTFTNTQGTWTVTAGVMTFTPVANFTGTASITYTVNDNSGATSNIANITVNVVPVNDAPIANNDNTSTTEDTPVSLNVTNNDSDLDGTIDINTVDLDPTTAGIQNTFVNAQGTWSVTGGVVTFTPLANFNGSATIDYTVNDNSGAVSNVATITINVTPVNDTPVANNDSATTNEDTPVTFDITSNDTDIDGTINSNSVDLNPAVAGIQINISNAQGTWAVTAGVLTFTPAANFTGTASINYTVKDNSGLLSNVAVITINVLPLNDAPVANNDIASTNEDTPVTLDVVSNDNDVDGTIDANTVDLDPTTPGIQTTFTNGQGTWTVTNGVLTFTPATNFNGSASIDYTVNDNLGTTSNVATISITVVSVNDLPVANDDFATTNEDTPVTFNITNNDTDVDGSINSNTVDLNTTVAGIQTTFVNAQGTWTVTAGELTFTPLANFNGTASIVYTVKDNSGALSNIATINVNVVPVNDLPVANNDTAATNEDSPVTFNITNNDTDSDGTIDANTVDLDPATPGIQTTFINAQGTWTVANGVLTFTPALNFNGSASINYTVNDNSGATSNVATITINVTAVNDAPIATNDVASTNENTPVIFNITNNDIDVDGFINTSSVDLNPSIFGVQTSFNNAQGSWNVVAGVVTYTPALNFNGTTSITYTVNDNSGAISNTATITVTVLSVNNPPVANNNLATTIEDTPVNLNITNNDTDIDGTIDVNTVDLDLSVAGIQTTVNTAQGAATVAAGVLTFTPVLNFNGSASIPYRVNDNSGATSNIGMVTIQVTPVNDAPVLDNEVLVVNYNGSQTGDLTNAGDFDPDGTNLVVNTTPLVGPQNGTISIAQDGTFTYQPNANFVGTDLIVVQVCDQGSPLPFLCATDTIFITVNACSLLDANQDCDLDGLTNGQETAAGTDPSDPDTDGDGVLDGTEVADGTNPLNPCSLVFASQTVTPSTAWNNLDCDNDGLSNGGEIAAGTDPTNPDTDGDGVLDGTEVADGTNPLDPCSFVFASQTVTPSTAWNNLDCDNDGLSNGGEIAAGTDPTDPDTDGDGVLDGTEVADGTNPLDPCSFVFASQTLTPSSAWNNLDCDNDGLSNGGEIAAGTDPTNPDTDGDGVLDGTELTDGTNPLDPCSFIFANQTVTPSVAWNNLDCDNDGLTNGQEAASGTDPNNPDTDGDGVTDGDEFNDGTNPIDPCDYILSSQTVTPSPEWGNLDCDDDGLSNGEESGNGSDPTDPCSPFVAGSNCDVEIIVPEAFSPDGDGTNETFVIEGLQYFDENEIIIFNRWGSEVFRMSPYDNTWDGTSQNALNVGGDALPTGTYFYILDTKTEKYGVIKGYIYLKR